MNNSAELLERRSALVAESENAELDRLKEIETEVDSINEELRSLEKAEEERKAKLAEVEKELVEEKEIVKMEERKFGIDSKEYREAFFANLVGKATAEQRSIFADNATAGDGVALPVATDTAIWDQILSAHPILSDVAIVKSGIVMKVTQMTPDTTNAKAKKDSDPVAQITFTTNEKVLAGKDYCTYVTLSYAEAKMSQGAMEKFLVNEIAAAIGEELATDVFATIVTEAAANSTTKSGTYYEAVKTALGKATQAVNPVIYAPSALYYAILGEVDTNGQPIVRDGVVLGATLKKDNAAAKITVVDPALFVLNVIADTKITSQEVVAKGGFDIGGYMRAEGCLRKTNAAAFIA